MFRLHAMKQKFHRCLEQFSIARRTSLIANSRFFTRLKQVKKAYRLEQNLADALFQMSSTADFSTLENAMLNIGESNYGELSEEFKISYNEIKNGKSFKSALTDLGARNDSDFLKKAADVLVISYETGSDSSEALREIAEEVSKNLEIQRNRNSSTFVQRITLLAAGAFIIPLILGILISMVNSFDFSGIAEFGLSSMDTDLIILANQIYIVEYGILAAFFISFQEERKDKFWFYFLLMTPIALILFNLAKSGVISLI